jgi:photosystem II stability/assembly factor-like uncharacterized protein
MNKKTYIILFQFLLCNILYSQWSQVFQSSYPYDGFYNNLYFVDQNTGYISCRDSAIIKTTNGGTTWFSLNGTSNYGISQIKFPNLNTGYARGHINFSNSRLLKTTDAGNNWVVQQLAYYAFGMDFVDANTGYITSDSGIVHKTTNGGQNWISFNLSTGLLTFVDFINANTGFVFSFSNSRVFRTTNGGNNWQQYPSPNFNGFQFLEANTGYGIASSFPSILYSTTNGGNSWINIFQRDSLFMGTCFFINVNTGWVTGNKVSNNQAFYRKIYKTTTAGNSWFEQSTGFVSPDSSLCLGAIQMLDENTGYTASSYCVVVGGNPTMKARIFKTTNGGGGAIGINNHNEIIKDFRLIQNYPNPFNPVTVISFEIPVNTFVTIKLYDALGNELKVLSEGNVNAGYNEIIFDGSNFPSGVYFYRIVAGTFSDSKKMVLIK